MMVIMYVSAILCGLICRKSRICSVYILGVMYLISTFCVQNADYNNYENGYHLIASGSSTSFRYLGYFLFMKIWAFLGLSFMQYRMVFYFLVLMLLFLAIRRLSEDVNFVLALYMIFSFCIDAVQMKSFLATSVMFYGLSFLLGKTGKNRSAVAIFFCLSLIAATIHFSSVFYILAGFSYIAWQRKRNIGQNVFLLSAMVAFFVYSGGPELVIQIMNRLGVLGDIDYILEYFERKTKFGFLLGFIWVAMIVYCCCNIKKRMAKESITYSNITKFSSTALLALPLFVLHMQYTRIMRPYMVLMYIVYANQFHRRETKHEIFENVIFLILMTFVSMIEIRPVYDGTLGALFENNALSRLGVI